MHRRLRLTLLVIFAAAAIAPPPFPVSAQGLPSLRNFASQHEKPDCPKGDPVVWLNSKGTIYYPEASKYYGYTPNGKWICQSDAIKSGAMLTKTVPQPLTAPSGVLPSGAPSSAAPAAPASATPTSK
jgi:hypothetical protein